MSEEKTYEIGGKKYVQKKLVLGQIKQLNSIIGMIQFPLNGDGKPEDITNAEMLQLLIKNDVLVKTLAVVLCPENTSLKDRNLKEIEEEIEFAVDIETGLDVVTDFFGLNNIQSLVERMENALALIKTGTSV